MLAGEEETDGREYRQVAGSKKLGLPYQRLQVRIKRAPVSDMAQALQRDRKKRDRVSERIRGTDREGEISVRSCPQAPLMRWKQKEQDGKHWRYRKSGMGRVTWLKVYV